MCIDSDGENYAKSSRQKALIIRERKRGFALCEGTILSEGPRAQYHTSERKLEEIPEELRNPWGTSNTVSIMEINLN